MQSETITGYSISPQQRSVCSQDGSPAYRAQCAVRIDGDLNGQRLKSAVARVADRHEILRTNFYRPEGMKVPVQVIADDLAPSWREVDLTDLPSDRQGLFVEELLCEERRRPFDLEDGSPLQLSLLTLAANRHILLIGLPSLCGDAGALANIVREVIHYYNARNVEPLDEPLQYADYAEWQLELAESEEDEAQRGRAYWKRQEGSASPALRLPFEGRPAQGSVFAPDSVSMELAADLVAEIEGVGTRRGTDVAAFLMTCWQTLLWRFAGETDLVTGVVCDGRRDEALQTAVGLFARWIPIRSRFDDGLRFSDVLSQIHVALRDGAEWQEYLSGEEGLAAVDAAIGFECVAWPQPVSADGVTFSVLSQCCHLQRFKLLLSVARTDGTLTLTLHFDPAAYQEGDIERLARHLQTLIAGAAAGPESQVSRLPLLDAAERHRLLVAWNQTHADFPASLCLHSWFEQQVERTPDRPALTCAGRTLSYAQLNARANQLAHLLRLHGVAAGVPVALCPDPSMEMIVALMATLKAGGAYVPLNPEHPPVRLAQQLAELDAPLLLTEAAHAPRFADYSGRLLCLDRDAALWADQPATNPEHVTSAEDPVYIIYTSGSTGTPKGVVIRHRSLVNYTYCIAQRLGLADEQPLQFATVSTLTADLGNTCLFPSLVSGGCLHLLGSDVATDGSQFARYLAEHPIDVLKIVPSHLSALLASSPEGSRVLPRRFLILGGEALSWELVERIEAAGAGCELINHYGPTETTVGALMGTVACGGRWPTATVPIGRPLANTVLYVLDEEQQPVPVGVAGELYIGGAGLARGYFRQPERSAERFLELAIGEESVRVYRTGDRVRYLPDGRVEFLGRVDHQIKLRGYRVELGEIEAVLGGHPAVRQAVVVARKEAAGQTRLVSYVVGKNGQTLSTGELEGYLRERLPEYMVPGVYVSLEWLPLTPNGKVDRRALPAPEQGLARGGYVPPRTPAEATLAQIWAGALQRDQVGIHDNFFSDLGGDSILSIQIIARAHQAGLHLTPMQLFEHPTIAELAPLAVPSALLEAAGRSEEGGGFTPSEFVLAPVDERELSKIAGLLARIDERDE